MRAQPLITPLHRGRRPTVSCRHARVDGPERPSGRNAVCGITPATIMSPTRSHPGPRTEIRPGARAHHTPTNHRAHAPPPPTTPTTSTRTPRLPGRPCTDKEMKEEAHLIRAGCDAGPGLMQRSGEAGGPPGPGIARWG